MNEKIKIAIVDDDPVYSFFLVEQLNRLEDLDVVFTSSNGKELIDSIKIQIPDVVLLDLKMPVMDGLATVKYLKIHYPEIKKLVLTVHNDEDTSVKLIEKGANGFLSKTRDINIIYNAIQSVIKIRYYFPELSLENVVIAAKSIKKVSRKNKIKLTDRESEITYWLCEGLNTKEIAAKIFVSSRTVEGHIRNLMKKTKVNKLTKFVVYAIENGLNNFKNGKV
jgi:DNA-binding NarL/FixJ family response regulator